MYQIDSNRVEDYLMTMNNLVDELETVVYSMKDFESKLVWNSEAGEMNKDRYKKIMSYEEEVCDILNIFMLIYEKGLKPIKARKFYYFENSTVRLVIGASSLSVYKNNSEQICSCTGLSRTNLSGIPRIGNYINYIGIKSIRFYNT